MTNEVITLTGLWKNTDQKGETYLSGNLGNARLLIFKNKTKKDERDPDYRVCIAPKREKPQGGGKSRAADPEVIPDGEGESPF